MPFIHNIKHLLLEKVTYYKIFFLDIIKISLYNYIGDKMVEILIQLILDVTEEEFDYFLKENSALNYFLNGGCYDFVRIMLNFYTEAKIVINETNDHTAIMIDENIYDASGRIIGDFRLATKEDIIYMEEGFGIPEKKYFKGQQFYQLIIPKVKECQLVTFR